MAGIIVSTIKLSIWIPTIHTVVCRRIEKKTNTQIEI